MAGETLTAEGARTAMEVLLEQERALRYQHFGAKEALELGGIAASLVDNFGEGVSVTITRESDGVAMFQWVADDKDAKNLLFADGKRKAALAAGHASPWAQLEAIAEGGDVTAVWADVPAKVPACGAFPIRVGDEWVATFAVSGYMEGHDHEIIVRALERALKVTVPRWDAAVA